MFCALNAVIAAINAGYGREEPDEEAGETDLTLLEIEAKKTMAGA